VLITAYQKTIEDICAGNKPLRDLLEGALDRQLSKADPTVLTEAIKEQISAIEGDDTQNRRGTTDSVPSE
jgi:hypothetical protein